MPSIKGPSIHRLIHFFINNHSSHSSKTPILQGKMLLNTLIAALALTGTSLAHPQPAAEPLLDARGKDCIVETFEATDCSGSVLSRGYGKNCIDAGSQATPAHAYKITGCPDTKVWIHEKANCGPGGFLYTHYNKEGCFPVNTGTAWNKIWVEKAEAHPPAV